ncbi:CD99 molecule isoform X4 [Paramisgurnus dabryanus]|uniref:CD99 molecule isoform X4 n=1 Tax=Paramisgurnus dabryanus TaxID=90735 RepID=UPI003CCF74C9
MFFHCKMTSYLWIVLLASLVATKAQDLDLFDALDDEKPPTKPPLKPVPPKNTNTEGFDLLDAFDNDPKNPSGDPKKTSGDGFDLSDALGPGKNRNTEPKKPVVKPPQDSGTGGRDLDDKDLFDLNNGDYKPDGGQSGGRGSGPGYEGGASDQPQDLNLNWIHLIKILADKMPEGLSVWISNLKEILVPLLERVMELQSVADEKTEL